MNESGMARLMGKVDDVIVLRLGDAENELARYFRLFAREWLPEVYDGAADMGDGEEWCDAWIDDIDRYLLEVLADAWRMKDDLLKDYRLYNVFSAMFPCQWCRFKTNFDIFIFQATDRMSGELRRFLECVSMEANAFGRDVAMLGALHVAYGIGDAKFGEYEWEQGVPDFWDSRKTFLELRAELGGKRNVFDALREEQRKTTEAARAAAVNSAIAARNFREEVSRQAKTRAKQIKGGRRGIQLRGDCDNAERDAAISREVERRKGKGEKLETIINEIAPKYGLAPDGVKTIYYRRRRRA